MAVSYPLKIDQGSAASFCFCFEGDDGAIDLTGYTAAMQIRRSEFSMEAIDTLTTDNGRLVMDCNGGKITADFPCHISEKYPAGFFLYDIEVESPSGSIYRLLDGKIQIKAGVTSVRCSR